MDVAEGSCGSVQGRSARGSEVLQRAVQAKRYASDCAQTSAPPTGLDEIEAEVHILLAAFEELGQRIAPVVNESRIGGSNKVGGNSAPEAPRSSHRNHAGAIVASIRSLREMVNATAGAIEL